MNMGNDLDRQMSSEKSDVKNNEKIKSNEPLKGYLHMLVISAKGLRQMMKTRWFVYDRKAGKLKYYRNEREEQNGLDPVGEIDITSSTFCYNVEEDNGGEFTICTKMGEFIVSAGTPEKRMYWLQQLQKARREFSAGGAAAFRNSVNPHQMGLLKTPEDEEIPEENDENNHNKDASPFKDLMATLEKPADLTAHPGTHPVSLFQHHTNVTSPPRSADYYSKKTTFFQNLTRNRPNFRMPRSSSMRTPSPPGGSNSGLLSPSSSNKPLGASSTPGSFQALSKIRRSLRDKKSSSSAGLVSGSPTPPLAAQGSVKGSSFLGRSSSEAVTDRELMNMKEDLQAVQDEAAASKEVIAVLRQQVEELQKEKETLSELHNTNLEDVHLLEILQTKDKQIVQLENINKEKQIDLDKSNQQFERVMEEVTTYKDLIEVKDESIVRLTNQIHEMELKTVVTLSTSVPPSPRLNTPVFNFKQKQSLQRVNSNGISFDSDKGEFKEFVDVGVQTNDKASTYGPELKASEYVKSPRESLEGTDQSLSMQDIEKLQDMVTAYEMQNKFLNKEVLELNQLRQHAIDREQKLFIESSDWEAKFYQIQSKYLLLLNELHNPQVGVSASRQEMVSQLLKDIVEGADKPNLTDNSATFDRFGFRIDTSGNSLEDKAEKLRRQAEDHHDQLDEGACQDENREKKWDEAVHSLNSKTPFTMTTDLKSLLRQGIPISQRGSVWKAIVDHKLNLKNDKFETDYYKKLLANYNPSRNLTPAAKQIELDLLRTLPNNKHYDNPNADGIPKLRRVLLAYSVHNPDVEYCQGFNRLVAIALLFMAEEDAFWCLVYIIEQLMPSEYYSRDKQLIGAQVDQEVLKEMLSEKLPKLSQHFTTHSVDPALFTLNWFLCVFVDTMPVKTYLHIWDAFLFEGSKVLFRYAIAVFKYMENTLLKQGDYMSIYNTLRDGLEYLSDIQTLTQVFWAQRILLNAKTPVMA